MHAAVAAVDAADVSANTTVTAIIVVVVVADVDHLGVDAARRAQHGRRGLAARERRAHRRRDGARVGRHFGARTGDAVVAAEDEQARAVDARRERALQLAELHRPVL